MVIKMSKEYNKYLQEHKANVAAAFYWIQQNLPEILTGGFDYERQITAAHDQSKSNYNEYGAYDNYFYGKNQSYAVKQDFNKAWLNHIHNNPHHWQYWILRNDDGTEDILDMEYNYIIEMICDWWSFGFKENNLDTIHDWYNKNKNTMKLSDKTKAIVEDILRQIYIKLNDLEGGVK